MYRFFLNAVEGPWLGTLATHFKNLKSNDIDKLRKSSCACPSFVVENAGWHFTSMGGLERYIKKLDSFAHTPENTMHYTHHFGTKTHAYIDSYIQEHCRFVEIDQTFLRFILDHQDYFQEIGFIRPQV
jgi:hypothetical protein